MNRAYLLALCVLFSGLSHAQSTSREPIHFDLTKIGMVVDGQQICQDKGRLQEIPSEVMDQIIAAGPKSVPVLIGIITDERIARTKEPIICYWPGMAIGDIAFCLLTDLFTDSSNGETTMPGAGYAMLGPSDDLPASEQLRSYIRKHGRAALQAQWRRLWSEYKGQVFWDSKERCFRLKAQ